MGRSYQRRETRISDLFDYLAVHPDGVTIHDIASFIQISRVYANILVQGLRDMLGDDTINLICEPNPADPKGPWLYKLVGDYAGAQWWTTNRILDSERRLQTQLSVVTSVANGAKANTVEGKKSRLMKKVLTRLLEDLQEINNG